MFYFFITKPHLLWVFSGCEHSLISQLDCRSGQFLPIRPTICKINWPAVVILSGKTRNRRAGGEFSLPAPKFTGEETEFLLFRHRNLLHLCFWIRWEIWWTVGGTILTVTIRHYEKVAVTNNNDICNVWLFFIQKILMTFHITYGGTSHVRLTWIFLDLLCYIPDIYCSLWLFTLLLILAFNPSLSFSCARAASLTAIIWRQQEGPTSTFSTIWYFTAPPNPKLKRALCSLQLRTM